MTPLPAVTAHPSVATEPWTQTSFLTTDPEPSLNNDASR